MYRRAKGANVSFCDVDGCGRVVEARGLCGRHYQQWQRLPAAEREDRPKRGRREPASHRFLAELLVAEPTDECIPWPCCPSTDGYGKVKYGGKHYPANRLVCLLAHGEPPSPIHLAAHSCGKGHEGCVNPRHLRWATPAENQADRQRHGTAMAGIRNPKSRLTVEDVLAIRAAKGTATQDQIGKRFGICQAAVWAILARKTYVDIEPET